MNGFSRYQKLVVVISVLASFVSFLDGFVVNVALPAIAAELGGGLAVQQWIVNAYLLTLGSLMLVAGALSDIFGRIRVLFIGLVGFGISSLLCALAPDALFLIIGRGFQGAAGALLVPSSLALIMSTFSGAKEGKAIGTWTSWTTIAAIVGPLVGGFLVDAASWRLIFAINVIPIVITLWLMRHLKKEHELQEGKIDKIGTSLCVMGLGGITYALIEQPHFGWSHPIIYLSLAIGLIMFTLFLLYEKRTKHPMLPLELFKNQNFAAGNIATFFIYGGLALASFIIMIYLQQIAGYSALLAGLTFLPVTFFMFALSTYFGSLAGKFGPRLFMTFGPCISGLGFLLLLPVGSSVNYWAELLPGICLFGLGLSITVAPLTTAILGSISRDHSGIGSAINNAVSRIAGLITVAIIGVLVGSQLSLTGVHAGLLLTAGLLFAGGIVSAIGIRNHLVTPTHSHEN